MPLKKSILSAAKLKTFLNHIGLPVLLVFIGLSQSVGHVLEITPLKKFGKTLVASPLPIVFTSAGGYETFASEYRIEFLLENGERLTVPLTSEIYNQLGGPYGRRAPYVHVFTLMPFYSDRIWNSVVRYGFCNRGPLAEVFHFKANISSLRVYVTFRTVGRNQKWEKGLECKR